jgi:hypothetical protein
MTFVDEMCRLPLRSPWPPAWQLTRPPEPTPSRRIFLLEPAVNRARIASMWTNFSHVPSEVTS